MNALFLLSLSLHGWSVPAGAATLECSDVNQKVHIVATLPANLDSNRRTSLSIRAHKFHVDKAFNWQTEGDIDETANGGIDWDDQGGLLAMRGEDSYHAVVIRLTAWDTYGVAKATFEEGAGNRPLTGACVLSKVAIGEIALKTENSARFCPENKDGEVCLMTWTDAKSYCESQGAHLPTAAEYAAHISLYGTLTVDKADMTDPVPSGYNLVPNKDSDGREYDFYMNHLGFVRPAHYPANLLLWTASIPPKHPQYAHVLYTAWGGGGGKPEEHLHSFRNAVQCAKPI